MLSFRDKIDAFKDRIKQDRGKNTQVISKTFSDRVDIEVGFDKQYRIFKDNERIVALTGVATFPIDCGTLDTIDQYDWSEKIPVMSNRKQVPSSQSVKAKLKVGLSNISKDDWSSRDYKGDNPHD